jgi:putative CocE/NonD family hydrolase
MQPLYLSPGRRLSWERPEPEGSDDYVVDPRAGTGERSRWLGLLNPFIRSDYPDRRARGARLLVYTSPPLEADMEVTGHPVVTLHVSASAPDATLFAYLEELAADGSVRYVTEGQLRALHRGGLVEAEGPGAAPRRSYRREHAAPLSPGEAAEVVFDLLPVSHRFRRGHAVRLAIAGADRDHFAPPPDPNARLQVRRGGARGSRIDLPVVG